MMKQLFQYQDNVFQLAGILLDCKNCRRAKGACKKHESFISGQEREVLDTVSMLLADDMAKEIALPLGKELIKDKTLLTMPAEFIADMLLMKK